MPSDTACPTCGTPLSGRMLGGLCPTCIRRVALAEPSLPGDTAAELRALKTPPGGWEPPSPEAVAAMLPAAYTVESLIGRGGMGAVYKGWQKSLERHVAIKILPPGLVGGDFDFTTRFKREARAMAKLKHAGIIPVHEAGETGDGLLYYVMDFVEGTDVQRMIAKRGRLPPEEALPIISRVLDALACAHQHGIIHRDIKPANLMVDRDGHVLVADFGLARSSEAETALLTGSHVAMGTPDFMAPEARNGAAHVDQRADLFAVGVILYQMLTGRLPHGRFDLPSRVVPALDRRLDGIVDKLLQNDRDKRYATAFEVKAALEPILTRTLARRTGNKPGAGKPKRILMLSAAALVVLAILAVGITRHPGGPRSVVAHAPAGGGGGKVGADNRSAAEMAEGKASPSNATKDAPFVNTLGMKFVPVPITGGPTDGRRVLFSVWETRVQDYEMFARETKREWMKPGSEQGPTHPAVMVSWEDAQAFCAWLTGREREAGKLAPDERYRLPSDHEWSCAVGIGEIEDAARAPAVKTKAWPAIFPWGTGWPPPAGAGNYCGEEMQVVLPAGKFHVTGVITGGRVITGYRDDYAGAAPVGSFPANRLGLHDLSGNVWEWCEDWCGASQQDRVRRGNAFTDNMPGDMMSSIRGPTLTSDSRQNVNGFRCVLAAMSTPTVIPAAASASPSFPVSSSSAVATKDAPFVNTLGMKFVPVTITGGPTDGQRVLFSVWETRVQDYAVFANETSREWPKPPFEQQPTHPAVMVSWGDAQAFCAWLTAREIKAGRLGAAEAYRLPSDHEWSCAVGIGKLEDPAKLPADKAQNLLDLYPWGHGWPPPIGAGNFAGEELQPALAAGQFRFIPTLITGYRDGYVNTAPVGSFPPSGLGLHDLSGNVWEWCIDLYDAAQTGCVIRGDNWTANGRGALCSSYRAPCPPDNRASGHGFRCVLEAK